MVWLLRRYLLLSCSIAGLASGLYAAEKLLWSGCSRVLSSTQPLASWCSRCLRASKSDSQIETKSPIRAVGLQMWLHLKCVCGSQRCPKHWTSCDLQKSTCSEDSALLVMMTLW